MHIGCPVDARLINMQHGMSCQEVLLPPSRCNYFLQHISFAKTVTSIYPSLTALCQISCFITDYFKASLSEQRSKPRFVVIKGIKVPCRSAVLYHSFLFYISIIIQLQRSWLLNTILRGKVKKLRPNLKHYNNDNLEIFRNVTETGADNK